MPKICHAHRDLVLGARQRDDASAGLIWISGEIAVWIYRISGGVKVCRLHSIENLIPVVVNCALNCRALNDLESQSGWHDLLLSISLPLASYLSHNDILYPGLVINGVQVPFAKVGRDGDYSISGRELWS
jgi:hypothetical protein